MKRALSSMCLATSIFILSCSGDLVRIPSSLSPRRFNDNVSNHPIADRSLSNEGHPDLERRLTTSLLGGSTGLGSTPSLKMPSIGTSLMSSTPGLGSIGSTGLGSGLLSNLGLGSGNTGSLSNLATGSLANLATGSVPNLASLASTPSTPLPQSTSPATAQDTSLKTSGKSATTSTPGTGAACSSYAIIDTRGTSELQGPSMAFIKVNSQIMAAAPGGKVVHTVYPAGVMQDSSQATKSIISQVTTGVSSNPKECYILEGYSQGAAATVNAMSGLTGAAMNAVKAVFLFGNPLRKSGLACNVDSKGGTSTQNVNGLSTDFKIGTGIPAAWVSKTLDVCASGDGICDPLHGVGINMKHLSYMTDSNAQQLGTTFIKAALSGQAQKKS